MNKVNHSQFLNLLSKAPPDQHQYLFPLREIQDAPGEEADDLHIRCSVCGNIITHLSEKFIQQGRSRHVFANPYGLVFETMCFKRAKGCVVTGKPSDEFTWFPGHRWQIALCVSCRNHLGWLFTSQQNSFFCLITDQLIFP